MVDCFRTFAGHEVLNRIHKQGVVIGEDVVCTRPRDVGVAGIDTVVDVDVVAEGQVHSAVSRYDENRLNGEGLGVVFECTEVDDVGYDTLFVAQVGGEGVAVVASRIHRRGGGIKGEVVQWVAEEVGIVGNDVLLRHIVYVDGGRVYGVVDGDIVAKREVTALNLVDGELPYDGGNGRLECAQVHQSVDDAEAVSQVHRPRGGRGETYIGGGGAGIQTEVFMGIHEDVVDIVGEVVGGCGDVEVVAAVVDDDVVGQTEVAAVLNIERRACLGEKTRCRR